MLGGEIMTFHCKVPLVFFFVFVFSSQSRFPSYFVLLHGIGWETTGNPDPEPYLWPLRLICKITDTLTLSSAGVWIASPTFLSSKKLFGLAGSVLLGQLGGLYGSHLPAVPEPRPESCKGLIREKCFEDEKVFSCVRAL